MDIYIYCCYFTDTNYVLANYKTEPCKRPPRLCRQGYACPSFHNTRDKRRSPKTSKYRYALLRCFISTVGWVSSHICEAMGTLRGFGVIGIRKACTNGRGGDRYLCVSV